MKIVVLDGFCMNPGDLSWACLEALGSLSVHERTGEKDLADRIREAEIVLTNKTPLPRRVIEGAPALTYIGLLATGYNVVDVEAARERKIPVTNVPTYGTESVAQMVMAHLLDMTLHVAHHAGTVREGRWARSEDFCYWDHPLVELKGLTLGIVGLGRIGQAVARLADAFGMKILAHDPALSGQPPGADTLAAKVESADLDRLFRESDVVSLHCPLTPETEGLVNRARLALMKPTAYLINTSRGPLVDEAALAEALNREQIAGAGLDVLAVEPPQPDHPLFGARNCTITPHIAWATRAARVRLLTTVEENLKAFLEGNPINVVNP